MSNRVTVSLTMKSDGHKILGYISEKDLQHVLMALHGAIKVDTGQEDVFAVLNHIRDVEYGHTDD